MGIKLTETVPTKTGMRRTYEVDFPMFIPKRKVPLELTEKTYIDNKYKEISLRMENRRRTGLEMALTTTIVRYLDNHLSRGDKPESIPGTGYYAMKLVIDASNVASIMGDENKLHSVRFLNKAINQFLNESEIDLYAKHDNDDTISNTVVAKIVASKVDVGNCVVVIKFRYGDKATDGTMAKWFRLHKRPKIKVIVDDDLNIEKFYMVGDRVRNPDCIKIPMEADSNRFYGEYYSFELQDTIGKLKRVQDDLKHFKNEEKRLADIIYKYLPKDTVIDAKAVSKFVNAAEYGPTIMSMITETYLELSNVRKELAKCSQKKNGYISEYHKKVDAYDAALDLPYIEVFD